MMKFCCQLRSCKWNLPIVVYLMHVAYIHYLCFSLFSVYIVCIFIYTLWPVSITSSLLTRKTTLLLYMLQLDACDIQLFALCLTELWTIRGNMKQKKKLGTEAQFLFMICSTIFPVLLPHNVSFIIFLRNQTPQSLWCTCMHQYVHPKLQLFVCETSSFCTKCTQFTLSESNQKQGDDNNICGYVYTYIQSFTINEGFICI